MITLPIPMIGAIVLGFLLVKLWLSERRFGPVVALLAVCAVQSAIIALAQHYQIIGFRLLQPITAMVIPPLAWIAFVHTTHRNLVALDLFHGAAPVAAAIALVLQPYWLDILIPLTFLGYGAAVLWQCRGGADTFPRARFETGSAPVQVWVMIGIALIISGFSDVIIIALTIAGQAWLQPILISLFSAGNLLFIGMLSLTDALRPTAADTTPVSTGPTPADTEVFTTLEQLMADKRPFLDPDLTLIKLARMTGIPAKKLSTAINRATGENVSRYINAFRIRTAQDMLQRGQSVTTTMFEAGFNTKSNFNREFLRVTGVSPSRWQDGIN